MNTEEQNDIRVLVVDDELIVQSLVRDALEDEGYIVESASNGHEAIELLSSSPFDLLITDIRMPGIDGNELVERAVKLSPSIGVIYITGYASLGSAKDAIKHGALDYIMKPFELHEIRQAVYNAVVKIRETTRTSSDHKLEGLSDLSHMLFAAGDRKSLITSSVKFATMHLESGCGSLLYLNQERDEFVMLSSCQEKTSEESLGLEPLQSILTQEIPPELSEPILVSSIEDHPLYQLQPSHELKKFLCPPWFGDDSRMITVPIVRSNKLLGLMMLGFADDTMRVKAADLKFLSIITSQLAISLENLSLLEETQAAYAKLQKMQDDTIELEKMATRGEMSAEIGHELNNFLSVVAGNVGLMEIQIKKQNFDALGKYLDAMTTTILKIKAFTSNLMDLRTISSAKEIVSFDKVIREVLEYLEPQKRFSNVTINSPEQMEKIPFLADVTQIQQLLYNLFNNAADATQNNPVREITVTVEALPDDQNFRVSIRDSGCGMDPEFLRKAFHEKFTTKPTGHGFGLVVCKRIIDSHGGELSLESSPGQGTTITITFPLASEVTEPAPVC